MEFQKLIKIHYIIDTIYIILGLFHALSFSLPFNLFSFILYSIIFIFSPVLLLIFTREASSRDQPQKLLFFTILFNAPYLFFQLLTTFEYTTLQVLKLIIIVILFSFQLVLTLIFSIQDDKQKYETKVRINKMISNVDVNKVIRNLDDDFDTWNEGKGGKLNKK